MKKSKGKTPFPWWEKRRQAIERKAGFSESQYIPLGRNRDNSSPVKWKEPVRDGEGAVQLSAQQEYVLDLIRQGKNVFYTGNAGTGKTTLLREIQKCAPEGTFVTALTGVAAVQAGGTTLHSFAGIGLGNGTKENLCSMVMKGQKAKNWRNANVLIIDEVSMLDGKLFDKLEYIARKIKRCDKPFGGIQLVLCGDFFQLPPIQKVGETSINYCFQSSSWDKVLDYSLELTQIYRQSDPKLIKLLDEVRYQHVSAESLELLNHLIRPLDCGDIEPTKLYSHNKSVNDINNRKLHSLEGEEKTYYASDHGQSPYKENLSKYVIAMEKLALKKGAQVMLLKNLTEELINGSRGVVEDFDKEGWPQVKFTDGKLKTITVVDWNLENSSGIVLACRIQVPLKLAWAITIHKSQGMSIDLLQVDLKHVFSQGQAYVALSRARTIEGLQVLTFDETKFTTSDAVIKFYREKIQKTPGHLTTVPPQTSTSLSLAETPSPKDIVTTPSQKRRHEEIAENSAKKRFRSSSNSSPVDFQGPKAKHEKSSPSHDKSTSSFQGEKSQMVSPSSSTCTPCVKREFQKASELYSDYFSQNKELSLPFFIEEVTDEECLLASPTTTPTEPRLVVKRKRTKQANLFGNFLQQPKDDEFTLSSNKDLKANGERVGLSWNTDSGSRQDSSSWNTDSGSRQDSSSWNTDSGSRQDSSSWNKDSGSRQDSSSWNTDSGSRQDSSSWNTDSGSRQDSSSWNTDSGSRQDNSSWNAGSGGQNWNAASGESQDGTSWTAAGSGGQKDEAYWNAVPVDSQEGTSWNTGSGGQMDGPHCTGDAVGRKSRNPDCDERENSPYSGDRQKSPLTCSTLKKQRSRATKAARRAENDENYNYKREASAQAKVKRQREKSKRRSSIMFDALKKYESNNGENLEDPSSIPRQIPCSQRSKSRTESNNQQKDKYHRRTYQQPCRHESESDSQESCIILEDKLNTGEITTDEVIELPSSNKTCFSLSEHQLSPSVIEVACERSRERSKTHCSKLFEALKEETLSGPIGRVCEEQQGEASMVPYYADKNLMDLDSIHRSASMRLRHLRKTILREASLDDLEGTESTADYLGYSTAAAHNKKTSRYFDPKVSSKNALQGRGTSSKDALTQTEIPRINIGPFIDPVTNHSDLDLQAMYLEFRISSMSFVITALNKTMRAMLVLAAIVCNVCLQVFCKQLGD